MPTDKFIKAGGFATRIRHYGFDTPEKLNPEKPVIMLLHGYLESLDVWEDFVPLINGFRVILMDIPGHGISEIKGDIHTMWMMAEVVSGVADYMEVQKFYLAGHSMGGYVASEFLARYPDRLAGVIMFHSTPNPDSEEKKGMRSREIQLVQSGKKDLLAATVDKGFAPANRQKYADFIEDLKELVILTEEEGIVNLLRGMMQRADHNETFMGSKVPQLFIMGEMDGHIPLDVARSLEAQHTRARFAYLAQSGHMGFVEEPEQAAKIIRNFANL